MRRRAKTCFLSVPEKNIDQADTHARNLIIAQSGRRSFARSLPLGAYYFPLFFRAPLARKKLQASLREFPQSNPKFSVQTNFRQVAASQHALQRTLKGVHLAARVEIGDSCQPTCFTVYSEGVPLAATWRKRANGRKMAPKSAVRVAKCGFSAKTKQRNRKKGPKCRFSVKK